jgi:hypothetical protein
MGGTSRMNREVKSGICEGLEVRLPGPTRPGVGIPLAYSTEF